MLTLAKPLRLRAGPVSVRLALALLDLCVLCKQPYCTDDFLGGRFCMRVCPLCAQTLSKLASQPVVTLIRIKVTREIVAVLTFLRLPAASATLTVAVRVFQGVTGTRGVPAAAAGQRGGADQLAASESAGSDLRSKECHCWPGGPAGGRAEADRRGDKHKSYFFMNYLIFSLVLILYRFIHRPLESRACRLHTSAPSSFKIDGLQMVQRGS